MRTTIVEKESVDFGPRTRVLSVTQKWINNTFFKMSFDVDGEEGGLSVYGKDEDGEFEAGVFSAEFLTALKEMLSAYDGRPTKGISEPPE